jgi:hypothetical protein
LATHLLHEGDKFSLGISSVYGEIEGLGWTGDGHISRTARIRQALSTYFGSTSAK